MRPQSRRGLLGRAWWGAATLVGFAKRAGAEPAALDPAGWARLIRSVREPMAVVFTAPYCGSCALALDAVLRHRSAQGGQLAVLAVEMEGGAAAVPGVGAHGGRSGVKELRAAEPVQALRHAVHPRWRGETPYLVLLRSPHEQRRVLGVPTPDDLAWLSAKAPAAGPPVRR